MHSEFEDFEELFSCHLLSIIKMGKFVDAIVLLESFCILRGTSHRSKQNYGNYFYANFLWHISKTALLHIITTK